MISVLVVDDDFRVADLQAVYAASVEGFQVVGRALTGAEAVDRVAALQPDLVLLDNYLPDRSGLQVCAELASTGTDVIMVTADGSAASVRAALGAGALNYLVKPFTQAELAGRLRAYARYRSRVSQGTLDQEQIDRAQAALQEGNQGRTPKGQSPVTARLVREALARSTTPRTAADVSAELGIARATAQRYLAGLVEEGRATMRLRYGSTGRPEHEYRWV